MFINKGEMVFTDNKMKLIPVLNVCTCVGGSYECFSRIFLIVGKLNLFLP
jgi:hypothetical protein